MMDMEWLNYHHLRYFWMVAREGSVAAAAERLHVAQPTVSAQVKQLESALGKELLTRVGRGLVLTPVGEAVFEYAQEIFALGHELVQVAQSEDLAHPVRVVVGVVDIVPKLIAHELLSPVLQLPDPVQLICREGQLDELLADLAGHELDLIIADAPIPPGRNVRAYNHPLGECGISFLIAKSQAAALRKWFPDSLHEAPFLLPGQQSVLHRNLRQWFETYELGPQIIGEIEDSALLKAFGQSGAGVFAVPTATEREVCRRYQVACIGRTEEVRERYFAISAERKVKHPAVLAVQEQALQWLDSGGR
jgi:LysR family transcriptional activator of nhaA